MYIGGIKSQLLLESNVKDIYYFHSVFHYSLLHICMYIGWHHPHMLTHADNLLKHSHPHLKEIHSDDNNKGAETVI